MNEIKTPMTYKDVAISILNFREFVRGMIQDNAKSITLCKITENEDDWYFNHVVAIDECDECVMHKSYREGEMTDEAYTLVLTGYWRFGRDTDVIKMLENYLERVLHYHIVDANVQRDYVYRFKIAKGGVGYYNRPAIEKFLSQVVV